MSIKQNANTDLQLVIDCIINNKGALKDVPLQTSSNIARCIAGNTIPITNVTQFICSDLQRVQKEVRAATGQLKKCTGTIEKVFNCTVDVFQNVENILQKIPNEAGYDWSILMYNWKSLEETFESCSKYDVDMAYKKLIKVFENISSCVVSNAANGKSSNDTTNRSVSASLGNSIRWLMILLIPILILTS
ncbi:uncharacterized protein [Leptinotarsa decemlineata]|uniref:uncharacterized protein n=1 Tax=Leptinotarsa decemlineata TaxID=7539 RepID=UPI003D304AAF